MWSLIVITSSVLRAENNVRSLPDCLSPGGVVRSGYETKDRVIGGEGLIIRRVH